MSSSFLMRLTVLALAVVGSATFVSGAAAQDRLSVFMKRKLEHAEKTLEALAKEDYDAIISHSQAISLLCEDELWMVLETPEYRERSKEFQRSVYGITEAARKKNLEGAALAYVDTTLKCVSCHQFLRKTRGGK